jgi:hypothetical protein
VTEPVPQSPALIERVMAAVRHDPGVEPMPRKKLSDADLDVLQKWAEAEKADIASKLATAAPGTTELPPDPKCTVHEKTPPGTPDRKIVTDREAAGIMELSCSHCHGKTGSFSSGDVALVGAVLLGSMLASYAKWRRKAQPPRTSPTTPVCEAGTCSLCLELMKRMAPNNLFNLGVTTVFVSGGLLAAGQLSKVAHTYNQFNNGDGSLNAEAFAGKVSSLTKVHGSITSGYMPIRAPIFPKLLSDANRKKLDAWFEQQQESALYEGCQVYPGTAGNVAYERASDACGKEGGRLPTVEQAAKLAAQGVGGGGCLWTSSFSDDVANPRKTSNAGAIANVGRGATCSALCLR